jgi:hypothetical protein
MARFILSFMFFIGLHQSVLAADCGQFRVVKGDVTYKSHGAKKFKKARINKKICQGDLVKTAKEARAKVVMADQNELNISPDTELLIEVYQDNKQAVLNVLNGKVRSNVKQKYQDNKQSHYRVKTKSAVAGVRGTEFLAGFDRATNRAQVITFEGEVAVGKMEGGNFVAQVSVGAGQETSARLGANPTPPRTIPRAQLLALDQESNIGDRDISTDPSFEGGDVDVDNELDNDLDSDSDTGADLNEGGDSAGADNSEGAPAYDIDDAGDRDLASVEDPDAHLPAPELDTVELNSEVGNIEAPTIPTLDNPILNNIPDNQQVNDTIINQNQKANILIDIRLPGQ